MPVIDGLQKHLIESAAARCSESLRMNGRHVMTIVLVADAHGAIADCLMASSWDNLTPGVAQGFGQILHRAGYTLEDAAQRKDPEILKGGVGGLI